MSEADFSPGPWTVTDYGIRDAAGHSVVRAVDGHVYDEYDSDSATIDFDNEADARLIAAAPDLYEAVRLFVEKYDADEDQTGVAMMIAYNNALEAGIAALHKARGPVTA